MDNDVARTAAFGVLLSLVVFELVVAARSWYAARAKRRGRALAAHGIARPEHGALLLSQAFTIRDHLARRRPLVHALREQYPALRRDRHNRSLRSSIERLRRQPLGGVVAGCLSCRGSRLRGEAHCLECRRRLVVPLPSSA